MQYPATSADSPMPAKICPMAACPIPHMASPASTFTRIRDVKSSVASRCFCSPIFFIMTAVPPVASMVEIAVTSWMTGAVRLMADNASVPMKFETNSPSTMV